MKNQEYKKLGLRGSEVREFESADDLQFLRLTSYLLDEAEYDRISSFLSLSFSLPFPAFLESF